MQYVMPVVYTQHKAQQMPEIHPKSNLLNNYKWRHPCSHGSTNTQRSSYGKQNMYIAALQAIWLFWLLDFLAAT